MLSTLIVIGTGLLSLSSANIFECDRPSFSRSVPSLTIGGQRMTPYKCADEGNPCYFRLGTQRNIVIYGAQSRWAIKRIDLAIFTDCTNEAMGCDPIEGVRKECHLIPWRWIQAATRRRRLVVLEEDALDSLTMEETDKLIEEWMDELDADKALPLHEIFTDEPADEKRLLALEANGVLGMAEESEDDEIVIKGVDSKRRLVVGDGLVTTGKVYGVPTGILTESPKTYDNAYIHHINLRYNEHLISVQLWSRTLELLAQGKFIGQRPVGNLRDTKAGDQAATYEVPDNTCIGMVRVYSEGQFIDGLQFCSRRDGFEQGSNTYVCSQVYGSDAGTMSTDFVPRYNWNGITACLHKIDIHHSEGSNGFINAMKFWYLPNVDALNE